MPFFAFCQPVTDGKGVDFFEGSGRALIDFSVDGKEFEFESEVEIQTREKAEQEQRAAKDKNFTQEQGKEQFSENMKVTAAALKIELSQENWPEQLQQKLCTGMEEIAKLSNTPEWIYTQTDSNQSDQKPPRQGNE